MAIKHILVVGAGTMGAGIAQVAATSGFQVTCMDIVHEALERASTAISKSVAKLLDKGALTAEQKVRAEAITFVHNLEPAAAADMIIEAATENPELKLRLFKELDEAAARGVILASNTSSIPITKIAAATSRPDRVIGMHFMNPVPLMRLVEVIRGLATSDETTAAVLDVCKTMGKQPVEAND